MSRERKSRRNASPPPATNSPGVVVPAKGVWQAGSRAEYEIPANWTEYSWNSRFGQGRERVWFSP
jgi:hypothetical protein